MLLFRLNISSVLLAKPRKGLDVKQFQTCPRLEQLAVSLNRAVNSGEKVTLRIEFQGIIIRSMKGLYRNVDKERGGVKR